MSDVNMVKHKGISKRTTVTEADYSSLIMQWHRQYDATRSVMGYDPCEREAFRDVQITTLKTPSN